MKHVLIQGSVAILGAISLGVLHLGQALASMPDTTAPNSVFYNAPNPPDQGAPVGRRQGGAGRGNCQNYQSLTALVPITQDSVWGKTASAYPSFWFYLPQAIAPGTTVEFVVLDSDDNYVYSTRMDNAEIEAGLIRFTLPATAEPFAIAASYAWTLSIYCNPEQPSESVFVSGLIQRADIPLSNLLTSPLAQGQFYAAQGLWYDALDVLAMAHAGDRSQPELTQAWADLLRQVGLEEFATVPFEDCCTVNP